MRKAALWILVLGAAFPIAVSAHEETVIRMTAGGFEPAAVEIHAGEAVTFVNEDARKHWPASNIHPTHTVYPGTSIDKCGTAEGAGMFDACRGLAQGESFTVELSVPGKWKFHDHLHAQYAGTVSVLGTSTEAKALEEPFLPAVKHAAVKMWWKLQGFAAALFGGRQAYADRTDVFALIDGKDEGALERFLTIAGPSPTLGRLLAQSEEGGRDCHQEAHQLGRAAYGIFGAAVFSDGEAACHSGFYHGAMERFLSSEGTDNLAENITELCDAFKTSFGNFECLHGVGHGVMAYESYDLPRALMTCKELGDSFAQHSCYGGVFMENAMAAGGNGAIPGHETKWLSDDPHFPCSALPDGLQDARYECYQMQTSQMLKLNGYDFAEAARWCGESPGDMIPVCFQSLGRDAAGNQLRDPAKTLALCAAVPDEYYHDCVEGAVNVVIDFWGPALGEQATQFCQAIGSSAERELCDRHVEGRKPDFRVGG